MQVEMIYSQTSFSTTSFSGSQRCLARSLRLWNWAYERGNSACQRTLVLVQRINYFYRSFICHLLFYLNPSLYPQLFQHPVDGLCSEVANLHEITPGEVLCNELRVGIHTHLTHTVQGAHEVLVVIVQEVVELHVLHWLRLLAYIFLRSSRSCCNSAISASISLIRFFACSIFIV